MKEQWNEKKTHRLRSTNEWERWWKKNMTVVQNSDDSFPSTIVALCEWKFMSSNWLKKCSKWVCQCDGQPHGISIMRFCFSVRLSNRLQWNVLPVSHILSSNSINCTLYFNHCVCVCVLLRTVFISSCHFLGIAKMILELVANWRWHLFFLCSLALSRARFFISQIWKLSIFEMVAIASDHRKFWTK